MTLQQITSWRSSLIVPIALMAGCLSTGGAPSESVDPFLSVTPAAALNRAITTRLIFSSTDTPGS